MNRGFITTIVLIGLALILIGSAVVFNKKIESINEEIAISRKSITDLESTAPYLGGVRQTRIGQQVLWTTDLIPNVNEAVDLGSISKRIDNLYVKTGYFGVISSASGNISLWTNDSGYLSSIASESYWDLAYNWKVTSESYYDTAYNWGDHSGEGYLTTVAYGDLTGNPSDVITAGTGLSWATDTLNAEVQTSDLHAAVTITGEDFLSLSTQQITANAINPDNLANTDFGDFSCDGSACLLDNTVSDSFDFDELVDAMTLDATTSISFGSNDFIFNLDSTGDFAIQDDGTTAFFVKDDGNVGIGTDAPNSIFHIKANIPGTVGSHPAGQLIIQNPTDSVFSNVVITAYESDGAGNPDQQLWYLGSSSGSNSDIILLNRRNSKLQLGTNGAAKMTILGDGNIGIGTASPGDKLTIYDASSSVNVRVQSAGPDTDAGVVLRTATAPYWTIYEDESDSQKFKIRDSVGGDRITVDTNGNVGIGTTSPEVEFEVVGAASISGNFDTYGTFTAGTSASHSFIGDLTIGDDLTITGDVLPATDDASNLGSANLKWKHLYIDGIIYADAYTNVHPYSDSNYDLGTSSLYWDETFTDKLYLNATATLDGATAGLVNIVGNVNMGSSASVSSNFEVGGNLLLSGDEKEIRFYNGTNYVGIKASTSLASDITLVLPITDGDAGQLLKTDGAGNLSWIAAGAGDVLSVGDCLSGICLDGTSDGGTYITFYNIDSNKTQLIASDTASDLVITLPATTGTLALTSVATLSSLTSVGTIGTGVWEGTAIADGYIPDNITIDLAGTATALASDPTDCGAGNAAISINASGDLTCAAFMQDGDINTFSELQSWVSDETLLKAGTLTDGKVCKYVSAETDIVCNYDDDDVPEAGDFGNLTAGTNLTFSPAGTMNVDDPFTIGHIAITNASVSVNFDVLGMASISGQLYVEDNRVVGWDEGCFTIASDTFDVLDDIPIWHPHADVTITNMYCKVTGGTSLVVTVGDGTNDMDSITCDADGQADDGSIANNTFSANELMEVDFGTNTGACDWVNYCITYTID